MMSDRQTQNLDYTFKKKEIEDILKRSKIKTLEEGYIEDKNLSEVWEEVKETNFPEDEASYNNILKFAREESISRKSLDETIESYLSLNYSLSDQLKENMRRGSKKIIPGFMVGLISKYAVGSTNPAAIGTALTAGGDLIEYNFLNRSFDEIIRDDPGSILGFSLGYYLSSLF